MKIQTMLSLSAAALLAGFAYGDCTCACKSSSPVGNWGLKLPYDAMDAGHMIVTQQADGSAEALILWRWGSPAKAKSIALDGSAFTIDHPWGLTIAGKVEGDKLTATVTEKKNGKTVGEMTGWRNPEIAPASTKDAVLGEPVDLLKDGLTGWKSMSEKAPFGWSIKQENGETILSNTLPVDEKGKKIHGANLMSVRSDFYDFNLSYDVRVPKDSNSGVYLRGRYEIQTIDSYGKPVDCHNMAAYYGRVTPSVAVEKKPGEWQHVDVTLYKRHLTVVLNGVTIIDNAPVTGITGGAIDANEFVPGPLYLQGDHSDADYKNMILRPVVK